MREGIGLEAVVLHRAGSHVAVVFKFQRVEVVSTAGAHVNFTSVEGGDRVVLYERIFGISFQCNTGSNKAGHVG